MIHMAGDLCSHFALCGLTVGIRKAQTSGDFFCFYFRLCLAPETRQCRV